MSGIQDNVDVGALNEVPDSGRAQDVSQPHRGWRWDGRRRENRSSRWGVPLVLVLSARASCRSPGLPLCPVSSPESPKRTIYILNIYLFNGWSVNTTLEPNIRINSN